MKDRISLYPGRVKLNPVAGEANTYDMVRADQPTQEGTALNKANLLNDSTATGLHLGGGEPTPDLAFQKMMKNVQVNPYRHIDKAAWSWFDENTLNGISTLCEPIYVNETNEFIILSAVSGGSCIYISKDFGRTFEKIDKILGAGQILVDYYNGTYIFVTKKTIYTTKDKKTFIEYPAKFVDSSGINSAAIDKEHGNIVFATTLNNSSFCYAPLVDIENQKKIGVSTSSIDLFSGYSSPLSYANGYIIKTGSSASGYASTVVISDYWTDTPTLTVYRGFDNSNGYIRSKVIYANEKYYYVLDTGSSGNGYYVATVTDIRTAPKDFLHPPEKITEEYVRISSMNGVVYICGGNNSKRQNIFKIENNSIYGTNFPAKSGNGYLIGIANVENSSIENCVIISNSAGKTWTTYDKYIVEDYLTDMAGNNLTLSPMQSPIHIETGRYTGAGTYGSSNPNSLTFGFEPKIVFLRQRMSDERSSEIIAVFTYGDGAIYQSYGYSSSHFITVNWDKNTVSWFSDEESYQLNGSRTVYSYVAIG